jgi:Cd2+/Zn2+-exporting ATPase
MTTCTVCELHAESTFKVEGMDCREEVALIERRFKNLAGVEAFSADVVAQRLHVTYDAAKLSTSAIAAAVADAGMRAWLEHEEPIAGDDQQAKRRNVLLVASAAAIGLATVVDFAALGPPLTAPLLYGLGLAAALPFTARKAWRALASRSLDINVLMLIAAAGAIALGEWSEAAAVVFLFAVAQALEARTMERARLAVRALMDLTPSEALVRSGEGERLVPAEQVAVGSIIVIKPGEKVPLDGEVVAGASAVNQAPVTGESLPIDKEAGDEVFAGSINGRGALDVRVTKVRRDTTLARVIHLVEQAQAKRAPAQAFVERFARVYTPAVIALAMVIAVVPPLFGAAWGTWVYRALVLLVVSCPCALVISTPVSVVAALSAAARRGVLVKGGIYLERAGGVRCIAFDKTGTLTRGTPQVTQVIPTNGVPARSILALAASVEQRSEHPIARAIVEHADGAGVRPAAAVDVRALAGRGAEGRVDGAAIVLGNHPLFEERRLCSPALHTQVKDLDARGETAVLVAKDDEPIGIIAVADRPREAVRDALDMLRRQGVESIVMLTGDSRGTAGAIASQLGITDVRAELMPEDKVSAVAELKRRYGSVAMVGDGINDAPALATADVGIVMGAAGSDAALETADIALMADELMKVPYALRLSRATMRNIKANLVISLALKAAFVVAAVGGFATLWMAVLADTGASIIVIANALRLLRAD